jgi:predicted RNA binding protein YcfA (HicA-like mRNA interferase family)
MRLPRDLNGRALIDLLCQRWGYFQVHQIGSHVVLETDTPFHHRIVVPDHKQLRVGTLSAILRAVSSHKRIARDDLLRGLK